MKSEIFNFFPFQWQYTDEFVDDEDSIRQTIIRVYGWNELNESVYVKIADFQIPIWVELPSDIEWRDFHVENLKRWLLDVNQDIGDKPVTITLTEKYNLYFADVVQTDDGKYVGKKHKYLQITFRSQAAINSFVSKLRRPVQVPKLGKLTLKCHCHESSITPVLKLMAAKELPSSSWILAKGQKISPNEKETTKTHEYLVKFKHMKAHPDSNNMPIVHPKVLSFDNEVYSHDWSFPQATHKGDKVFMIGMTMSQVIDKKKKISKHLLVLGELDNFVNDDNCPTEIIKFDSELKLFLGFSKFLREHDPDVLIGYNIFKFDIKFMVDRATNVLNCIADFSRLGCMNNKQCEVKHVNWSSSAYGEQDLVYFEADGRLFIDLFPYVERNYKLNNYKLSTVCSEFLPAGVNKDPITAKQMFKTFEEVNNPETFEAGKAGMAKVGKYCVQDSAVVLQLFDKLLVWFDLVEAATTCCVPMIYLYTKGQQIKMYSQMLKYCMKNDIVVQSGMETKEDEQYVGATVTEPLAGLYKMILPFDFASLYPSIIMAYNIDYSKLVNDIPTPNLNVKDEDCDIFEWDEHYGCSHDPVKRLKTKDGQVKRICGHYKYRFLRADKGGKGVIPTLLANLIKARKDTRLIIADNEEKIKLLKASDSDEDKQKANELYELNQVLDKRQLSYKVSANSMYGAMGVKKGYLPFLPGAMVVTKVGRDSIKKASAFLQDECGGQVIYNDTDSAYTFFPALSGKSSAEIWEFAADVVKRVAKLFRAPMKLEFEDKVYCKFLILTKKRYMGLMMSEDGKIGKLAKRGVVLQRRDNCRLLRDLYEKAIMYILGNIDTLVQVNKHAPDSYVFNWTTHEDPTQIKVSQTASGLVSLIINGIDDLFNYNPNYTFRDFVITKGLSKETYKTKTPPVHVFVAQKMRNRGLMVPANTRIEYLLVDRGKGFDKNEKQIAKAEDLEWFIENKDSMRLDYLYYLQSQIVKPMDELLRVCLGKENIIKEHFKQRVLKNKWNHKVRGLFMARIVEGERPTWSDCNLYEYTYIDRGLPAGYEEFFEHPNTHKIIKKISDSLEAENRTIFPALDDVWRSMLLTPLKDVRCVILGQDPYHTLFGNTDSTDRIPACGVAFHVKTGHNVNPSMANIIKELKNNGYAADSSGGDLSRWTQQGVILLNTALTVAAGEAESHLAIWRPFTTAFLEWIGEKAPGMLWGKKAIEYKTSFTESVCTKHPSPLAAAGSSGGQYPKFENSLCFKKMNELLKKLGKPEINWDIIDRT